MPTALYPILLDRTLSPRLWGGTRLGAFLNIDLPSRGDPIGETWEVYQGNVVVNGLHAGLTLGQLCGRLGAALLGTEANTHQGSRFPLLTKFIDAGQKLSIQVHPDDAFARAYEAASGHLGKTEAWLVLEAEPGAEIIWGFKESVSAAAVRRAVEGGTLETLLNHVPVAPGDVIYNPAGTVHAIGAGILLFEVQQSSDLTYRLYDYLRLDASGNPRELHLDRALAVADLGGGERARVAAAPSRGGWARLLSTPFFRMEERELSGSEECSTNPDSLEIITVLGGSVVIGGAWEEVALGRGGSAVLPAALGDFRLTGEGRVVRTTRPGPGAGPP